MRCAWVGWSEKTIIEQTFSKNKNCAAVTVSVTAEVVARGCLFFVLVPNPVAPV